MSVSVSAICLCCVCESYDSLALLCLSVCESPVQSVVCIGALWPGASVRNQCSQRPERNVKNGVPERRSMEPCYFLELERNFWNFLIWFGTGTELFNRAFATELELWNFFTCPGTGTGTGTV